MSEHSNKRRLMLQGLAVAFFAVILLVSLGIHPLAASSTSRLGAVSTGLPVEQAQANPDDLLGIKDFNCADVHKYGIDRQLNLRAAAILSMCRGKTGVEPTGPSGFSALDKLLAPFAYGGFDVNVHPSDSAGIQSTASSWRYGNTVVVTYNDFAGGSASKGSYSTDGGATFARFSGDPFATGHGANLGEPVVVYNVAYGKWIVTTLAIGCGGGGLGAWFSTDGMTWNTAGCVANTSGGDRTTAWQDNYVASPYYGRTYVAYNDYDVGSGAIRAASSTDGGFTWSASVNVTANFIRNVQLTVLPNGNVIVAGMDEGGGGANNRQNIFYRSSDGGATWTTFTQGPPFAPPGNANCSNNSYFRVITPQMRHMGWGQPAASTSNVVHYAYTAHGAGSDEGDIYYVRSTDGGVTWSAAFKLNTDATTRAQWMPSMAATGGGEVFVKWYDRRDTSNNDYWIYGRLSTNNGVTWQAEMPVSDAVIPQPTVQTNNCYGGDNDTWQADGNSVQGGWTDSRGSAGTQDVFHDDVTVHGTPPTAGPSPTTAPTSTPSPTQCGVVFNEGFESGTLGAFSNVVATCVPGGCGWAASTTSPHSGSYSAFAPDVSNVSDQQLSMTGPVVPAPGSQLTFWHTYGFEYSGSTYYDGGVLEASTNGGSSWADMGADILSGGYNGTISTCCSSPLASRQAWVADQATYAQVVVDLAPYAGQNLQVRFRLGTDSSVSATGWRIDDIVVGDGICPTSTPEPTNTATPISEATSCPIQFGDVPSGHTFYQYIRCLACRGIVSGYSDGNFLPGNNVTRGQISKIVSNAAGFGEDHTDQTFEDIPVGHTFYIFIERLASRGIISGYDCGGAGEPCIPPGNRPYFRSSNSASRGQLSKIVCRAYGCSGTPSGQTFEDVPADHTFYTDIEQLYALGAINGYPCGSPPAGPCIPPGNRPYFLPGKNVSRGQTAKIVANVFFPGCLTPAKR